MGVSKPKCLAITSRVRRLTENYKGWWVFPTAESAADADDCW